MSVSSLSGVNLPTPGAYSANSSLPWGIGASVKAANSSLAALKTATKSPYQTAYANFVRYNNAELLYATALSPFDGIWNGNAVLGQAAALLGTPGSLARLHVSGTRVNTLA